MCIEGTVGYNAIKKVQLYNYSDGNSYLLAEAVVSDEGKFKFDSLSCQEGLYLLGMNEKVMYPIYLKGGDELFVRLDRNHLVLDSVIGEENRLLYEWENRVVDVREYAFLQEFLPQARSVSDELFFEELSELYYWQQKYESKLEGCHNKKFADFLRYKTKVDLNFYALSYLQSRKLIDPKLIGQYEYYKKMTPDKLFQNDSLLYIPYASNMLISYVWYVDNYLNRETKGYKMLGTDKLRKKYLVKVASTFRFYDDYKMFYDEIESEDLDVDLEGKLKVVSEKLAWSKPGSLAKDFKGMRQDSSFIALSDLRGRVVVVDVWATWCAPCRKMMPYFVKLEKEFKSSDVVFLSVCMGVSIERELWMEIIEKDHLEGNHCFIDSWTGEFARNYRITGVPRYMVFDKFGRIVSLKAPFPNSSDLKALIISVLKDDY